MAQQLDWDPAIADQEVRIRSNPGRRGTTTGKTRTMGTTTLVQIQFGPNERSYKPYPLLELCGEPEDIESLLAQARFGGPDDLRRILTFEKVKGHLTNIFYSMEVSNTDFYAHQFKPVAKFIESPVGRILIADEVGLGKTVEAIYIWKELQARADARRLLIVCPAILREKWQSDLRARFNLFADIVSTKQLLEKLNGVRESNASQSFIAITSLEGLRPSNDWESGSGKSARAEFARLLDSTPATDEFGLLDLVIIDEAHYLRNPSTANHRLGHLLRDAARHLILLTATPIQINSDNLYQLLRLISPEDFFNAEIFQDMLQANEPVVRALRSLWQHPPDITDAQNAVATALKSKYFRENPVLQRLQEQLAHAENLEASMRASLGFQLENSSLLSQYLTRSRKRDVLPNRVKRSPQSLTVKFSPLEQEIYDHVSSTIRQRAKDKKGGALFSLISRQRQMASSMVAALETWRREGILSEFNAESNWAESTGTESSWEAEQQWQDFGRGVAIDSGQSEQAPRAAELFDFSNLDLKVLEQQDSKYQELVKFLQEKIAAEPGAKFVIFAYFRGTLEYLRRRLNQDGINNCLILGGQGDDKWENIRTFEETDVPVLLSSEVGSEGIDLQFCRFLINYDLPWNPMRVEQRIGRLDRLGQKAERISVINFSLVDTIEEKILERLYERIEIFRESVGDLENILGGMTEQLMLELLQPGLSKREQEKKVEQTADAILKQRHQQNQLEQEAINMVAFSDHILTSIDRDRQQGRWLQPQELQAFVNDFFAQHYPGTLIEPQPNQTFNIHLSTEAQNDLTFFIQGKRFPNATRLSSLKVNCFFEPKRIKEMGKGKNRQSELLDPTHPLIAWIQHCYEQEANAFYPIAASQISSQTVDQPPGLYFYLIHRWSFSGLRSSKRLAYQALQLSPAKTPKQLSSEDSEALVNQLMLRGQPQPNATNLLEDWQAVQAAFTRCDEQLEEQFFRAMEDFRAENENRCNVQERNARDYAQRRRQTLAERLQRFQEQGQTRIIPATEGQLAKLERELAVKLKTVDERRNIEDQMLQLAAGLVWVTEVF